MWPLLLGACTPALGIATRRARKRTGEMEAEARKVVRLSWSLRPFRRGAGDTRSEWAIRVCPAQPCDGKRQFSISWHRVTGDATYLGLNRPRQGVTHGLDRCARA